MTDQQQDGCWFALGWFLILLTEAVMYGVLGYSLWRWGREVQVEHWIIFGLTFALLLSLWLNAIQGEERKTIQYELRLERAKNNALSSASVTEGAD